MKKKLMNKLLDDMIQVYPSSRLVKDLKIAPSRRDPVQTDNYYTVKDCDFCRLWVYTDLIRKDQRKLDLEKTILWFTRYLQYDFFVFNKALDWVYESVRVSDFREQTISQFKAAYNAQGYNIPLKFLLAPIWVRLELLLTETDFSSRPTNEWVSIIRDTVQWTRLSQKCVLDDPSLDEAAYETFTQTQEYLANVWSSNDLTRDMYVLALRDIIADYFVNDNEFVLERGKLGSGSVAEENIGRDIAEKCKTLLQSDARINYLSIHNPGVTVDTCGIWMPPMVNPSELPDRGARFLTVPKNLKKKRGIGPQRSALMFWQQATLDTFYRVVWCKPYVRKHLPIFNREVNRVRAREGSLRNDSATFDLSAASDSVSVHLVKRLFGRNVRRALLCARSEFFSRDPLKRFETYATMGDASTFPVETIIFGACVKLALALAINYYKRHRTKIWFDPENWSVFGDDIEVPNDAQVVRFLLDILRRLGFQVNQDKSFVFGPYRESCGCEAYLGEEIQPIYCRFKLRKAERLGSLIGFANQCYFAGLKNTRQWTISLIAKLCKGYKQVPWTERTDDNSSVFTPFIDESRVLIRMVSDRDGGCTWCREILAVRVRSRAENNRSNELESWYAMYISLSSRTDIVSDVPIDYRARKTLTKFCGVPVDSVLL